MPGLGMAPFSGGNDKFFQISPLLPILGEGKAQPLLPQPLINAEHAFHYTDCSILLLTRCSLH